MPEEVFPLIEEMVERYEATRSSDGSVEISMKVSREFADLVLLKLSELRVTASEVEEHRAE